MDMTKQDKIVGRSVINRVFQICLNLKSPKNHYKICQKPENWNKVLKFQS